MTKYLETLNVQPTTTQTLFVGGSTFSWTPEGDRLVQIGAIEVSGREEHAKASTNEPARKNKPKR